MTHGDATFDPTGAYRYRLSRVWDETRPSVCWVMLNPSTATALVDDPTISRVVAFSRSWGFGSVSVVNLFALCTSDPRVLSKSPDPVGCDDDEAIAAAAVSSSRVITGWGNHGSLENPSTGVARSREVRALLEAARILPMCLGLTREGEPRHPLYLAKSTVPVPA